MQNSTHKTNKVLIEQLQLKAKNILDALIPDDAEIILLDYPHHPNVGDSLIWLGEIAYLKSRGMSPKYVSDFENYSKEHIQKSLNEKTIILFHGGGNFGTIYKHHHDFKLKVMSDFYDVPIIQLPQTIKFEDEEATKVTAAAIKKHGNFTLLARSQKSFDFSLAYFSAKCILCPDMAFFIGSIKTQHPSIVERFFLLRTDAEKANDANMCPPNIASGKSFEVDDWLDMSRIENFVHRVERHHLIRKILTALNPSNQVLLFLWNLLCTLRMHRGVAKLSKGGVVVTDRLHAHILSVLMYKPHVLVDNSYGKLLQFYQAWTKDSPIATFVSDSEKISQACAELDLVSKQNESRV